MRTADILKIGIALVAIQFACVSTQASWYWPFGSDEKEPPRLSELMEPASLLIDEAYDFAAAGSNEVAVATYRKALAELDRIETAAERETPGRTKKPEFATLRNKRAYVEAAIESLQMGTIRENARAVAVSDTDDLERKFVHECLVKGLTAVYEGKGSEAQSVASRLRDASKLEVAALCSHCVEAARNCAEGDVMRSGYALTKVEDKLRECATLSAADVNELTNSLQVVRDLAYGNLERFVEAGSEALASNEILQVAWASGTVTELTEAASNVWVSCRSNLRVACGCAAAYKIDCVSNAVRRAGRFQAGIGLTNAVVTLKSGDVETNRVYGVDGRAVAAFEKSLRDIASLMLRLDPVRAEVDSVERELGRHLPGGVVLAKREEKKMGGENRRAKAAGSSAPSNRERAIAAIRRGDYAAARRSIDAMLKAKPNGAAALNLLALVQIKQGNLKAAEETLDRCIMSNPKSHSAYYNMCELCLRRGDAAEAKRYYEAGRACGGPKNAKLEGNLK